MATPVYVLTINAVTVRHALDSHHIQETANGRNLLSITIYTLTGTYRPGLNDEIILTENGTRIFGGLITSSVESSVVSGQPIPKFTTRIEAADFNAYLDFVHVSGTVPEGTLKQQLQFLDDYLATYGVTLDPAQVTGPAMPAIPSEYDTVSSILAKMSQISLYPFEITYQKLLRMFLPTATAAPFNVTVSGKQAIGDVTVEPNQLDYANRVIVRFTSVGLPAYAFLGASANFSHGETVTLGGTTYTYTSPFVNSTNNVRIGANAQESLYLLQLAIQGTAQGMGVEFGTGTQPNSQAYAYVIGGQAVLKAIARTSGASGNSIATAESAANAHWYTEGGGTTSTLRLGADETLTSVVEANDLAEQAGPLKLREKVLALPDVRDYTLAQQLANATLVQSVAAKTGKRVTYVTAQLGIHPGQTQTITHAPRNLSGTWLVTDVEIYTEQRHARRRVVAVGGTAILRRWQDEARVLFGGGSGGSSSGFVFVGGSSGQVTSYFLGGNATLYVQSPTPTWVPVDAVRVQIDTAARGSETGTVRLRLRATAGSVTARLQNVTNTATVGTSAAVSTTTWTDLTFPVTLTPGSRTYELQVLPSLANTDVAAVGYFE